MTSWTIPSADGSEIVGYELGGAGDVLLIAHATGLCGPMYQQLADELTANFRVVAFDFRGHGRSSNGADIDVSWYRMADDVSAVVEHLGVGQVHAFGHSMGGATLLLAELNKPGTFCSLYLFEPIVFPDGYPSDGQNVMSAAARRRRPDFGSRAEVLYRYASRPPFNSLQAGVLAGYVDNGFADDADGRVRLCCLPENEALVFEAGRHVTWAGLEGLAVPTMVGAGHDDGHPTPALLAPPLAAALQGGQFVRYDNVGHFGPLQDPWTIARDIRHHGVTSRAVISGR